MLSELRSVLLMVTIGMALVACGKDDRPNPFDPDAPKPTGPDARAASLGIVGSTADIQTSTKAGIVIMGGGSDVDAAFRWMIARSGGGDVVVIRATGTDAYNPYIDRLGNVNSVETLKIDSRKLADNDDVAQIIRNAEMLFIAGGDQSDYTGYWKGTKVMSAINYLINEKKVPVGGTSAGAAILGNYYYTGERGSVTSTQALANPYHQNITLGRDDFLRVPYLQNVVTDQHFSQRDRQGRTAVFLARIMKDWGQVPFGIAVDEATAVCIDENGLAEVVGRNKAFFLKTDAAKQPENMTPNSTLSWHQEGKAIEVSAISATAGNQFNLKNFQATSTTGLETYWWSVNNGQWIQIAR